MSGAVGPPLNGLRRMSSAGSRAARIDAAALDRLVADTVAATEPGCVVAIALGGVPVYRAGRGVADLARPVALSPATALPVGSVTKQFTAFAYLLLCESGLAAPNDPIAKYFPAFASSPLGHATVLQLMGHTTGLADAYELATIFGDQRMPLPASALLQDYAALPANGLPGVQWSYNNGGYMLLGAIIEQLANRRLEEVLEKAIFTPLGMSNTRLRRWDAHLSDNEATAHIACGAGKFEPGRRFIEGYGQGGIVSSADDLLRWLASFNSPSVARLETWHLLTATQALDNGRSTFYACGLAIGEHRGTSVLFHAGGVVGANAQILRAPEFDLDVVVLANRSDLSSVRLCQAVLDECLPDLETYAVLPQSYDGVFRSSRTGRVIHLFRSHAQSFACIDGVDIPIATDSDGRLRPAPLGSSVRQFIEVEASNGAARALRFSQSGAEDYLERVAPRSRRSKLLAGRFFAKPNLELAVASHERSLVASGQAGRATYDLENIAEGVWRLKGDGPTPVSGILTANEARDVVRLSSSATRSLQMERFA